MISTHMHVPASIRMALRAAVPTVVLIRDPLESVASRMVKCRATPLDTRIADQLLAEYGAYYAFVERNRPKLAVVDFRTVTERPVEFLARSGRPARLRVSEEPSVAVQEAWHNLQISNRRRPVEERCIPDALKEQLKSPLQHLLRSRPLLAEARRLYEDLSPAAASDACLV